MYDILIPQLRRTDGSDRFEKSLYDLIRGLRNHKGNEREYIQHSLRECRTEIRGSDMDLKATALLKLIYLEMFGHDMSWASFHVLEVMSCQKYPQKRVGYLAAVQSFRPDTDVLMLATNLLKKVWRQAQPALNLSHWRTGRIFASTSYNFVAARYYTSRYHLHLSNFSIVRPFTKTITFEPQYTEEDRCCPLPACASIPGDFTVSLA